MLRSLKITGFRAFDEFEMKDLTRVNLLVGANNSGKTCVLEAVEILSCVGEPFVLLKGPTRRSELERISQNAQERTTPSITNLFHGRRLRKGSVFTIAAADPQCQASVSVGDPRDNVVLGPAFPSFGLTDAFSVNIKWSGKGGLTVSHGRVSEGGGVTLHGRTGRDEPGTPCNYVSTERLDDGFRRLWDSVVLTPKQEQVIDGIRIVEPTVEGVAPLSAEGLSGVVVKLSSSQDRVPLGSLGDGVKRLLVQSLNLVTAAGGTLLVDDIDTGLHYSVMTKLWKLVIETARKLDVQVFATTHSLDCERALAWACVENSDFEKEVSVHRLERGKPRSTDIVAPVFVEAMKHDYEMR